MIDFELDDTQKELISIAQDFGKEILQPAEIELDKIADPGAIFEHDLFKKVMAKSYELGFHKMPISEEYGGLGVDPSTAGLIWEELARYGVGLAATLMTCATVPRLITFLASNNKELIDKYVIPFCEDTKGEQVSAWGSSEPNIGSDGSNYYDTNVRHQTTAIQKDGQFILNGVKSDFVSNGGIANVFMMFACINPELGIRGSGAFIIPRDAKGISVGKTLDKVGLRILNQAPIAFDDVSIPESYLLFPPGDGYIMLHNSILTAGNIGVGYLAVGLMRAAYEEALQYSKERIQWGKPIFEHQLVMKKIFEIYQAIEASRAYLWKASWLCKKNFPGDLKTSLSAKIYATELAVTHTAEMVQVLGGYGISKEYTLEKYVRDALLLKIMDGTNESLLFKAAAHLS